MKKKIKIKKTQKFRNQNITCVKSRVSESDVQSRAELLCRERRCAEGALVHSERLTEAEARESEASLTEAEARESEASSACSLRRAA